MAAGVNSGFWWVFGRIRPNSNPDPVIDPEAAIELVEPVAEVGVEPLEEEPLEEEEEFHEAEETISSTPS